MSTRSTLLGAVVGAAALVAGATTAPLLGSSPAAAAMHARRTTPDPAQFTRGSITNAWFPLKPGTRMVYRGVKDGKHLRDVFYVTHQTRTIQGVVCRSVADRGYLNGVLAERTTDWYAQNVTGDVWYFGERTAELNRLGKVTSREGSWLAGRDGAKPGIYITAHPRVGQARRQEYYKGHAEDHFKVLSTATQVAVPMLRSRHAVETKEWSPLEPGVVDHKYYVRDIGVASEQAAAGPKETARLVSVSHLRG